MKVQNQRGAEVGWGRRLGGSQEREGVGGGVGGGEGRRDPNRSQA
jgi:hypothetical protein